MTELIIIYVLSVLLLITIKVITDTRAKNVEHRVVGHTFSAMMMVIFYSILASSIFNNILGYSNWVAFTAFLSAAFTQWVLFDLLFNYVNGDSLMHVGKTSVLDKFLSRFHPIVRAVIKIVPLGISIGTLIWLL